MLRFNHKEIRSRVIKRYMERNGIKKAVCFSCGNAAERLAEQGVEVLHIGERGDLVPRKWYTQAEISNTFPEYFDATSGHLPMELMLEIAAEYKKALGDLPAVNDVPCGSGETLVCLKLAYKDKQFRAIYNLDKATEYSDSAPLNQLVELLADEVIKDGDING